MSFLCKSRELKEIYDDEHEMLDCIRELEYERRMRSSQLLNRFSNQVARYKTWFTRSLSYVSWIQTPLLLLTLLNTLVLLGLDVNIMVWAPIIMIGGVVFLLAVGYVDEKLNIIHKEQSYAWSRNDSFQRLEADIAEIKEALRRK